MGTLLQSVSQACSGLWTQAKASEPPSPGQGWGLPEDAAFPHTCPSVPPSFSFSSSGLFAHWPLCSSQGVPLEVGAFFFHPLGHRVAVPCPGAASPA